MASKVTKLKSVCAFQRKTSKTRSGSPSAKAPRGRRALREAESENLGVFQRDLSNVGRNDQSRVVTRSAERFARELQRLMSTIEVRHLPILYRSPMIYTLLSRLEQLASLPDNEDYTWVTILLLFKHSLVLRLGAMDSRPAGNRKRQSVDRVHKALDAMLVAAGIQVAWKGPVEELGPILRHLMQQRAKFKAKGFVFFADRSIHFLRELAILQNMPSVTTKILSASSLPAEIVNMIYDDILEAYDIPQDLLGRWSTPPSHCTCCC